MFYVSEFFKYLEPWLIRNQWNGTLPQLLPSKFYNFLVIPFFIRKSYTLSDSERPQIWLINMSPCTLKAVCIQANLLNLLQAEHTTLNTHSYIQNPNPEAEQSRDNGRNIAMFSSSYESQKNCYCPSERFSTRENILFLCIPDNWNFFFSFAKECQRSDPSTKSGSSSSELFMIYAYCHKGFEAWNQRTDMTNMLDSYSWTFDQRCVLHLLWQ